MSGIVRVVTLPHESRVTSHKKLTTKIDLRIRIFFIQRQHKKLKNFKIKLNSKILNINYINLYFIRYKIK